MAIFTIFYLFIIYLFTFFFAFAAYFILSIHLLFYCICFFALMRSSRRARVSGGVSERATDISFYIREFNFWNFELSSRRLSRLLSFSPILTFEFLAYLDFWLLTFNFWLSTSSELSSLQELVLHSIQGTIA